MSTKPNNEADIIFNRANVALARSQRLVASWLPPKSEEENRAESDGQGQDEKQRLEEEMFTPVPERLGLGALIPKQGGAEKLWNQTDLSANDKLRQQLLGRNYKKLQQQKQQSTATHRASGATDRAGSSNLIARGGDNDDDDDEEEGRSALGRSKKSKSTARSSSSAVLSADVKNEAGSDASDGVNKKGSADLASTEESAPRGSKTAAVSKRKGAGNFLDDLLSDRKRKRKKQK